MTALSPPEPTALRAAARDADKPALFAIVGPLAPERGKDQPPRASEAAERRAAVSAKRGMFVRTICSSRTLVIIAMTAPKIARTARLMRSGALMIREPPFGAAAVAIG
ncbi:MAG: ABC-type dipeptide/oligopeptide/nickel transport system permease subunit [Paracoccaceae bacterium]|jgi:ABC-type dipeptide/oligopeptide/nickel transport system permease subunit